MNGERALYKGKIGLDKQNIIMYTVSVLGSKNKREEARMNTIEKLINKIESVASDAKQPENIRAAAKEQAEGYRKALRGK